MVWPFKKKEEKEIGKTKEERIPELPELPELPPLSKKLEAEKIFLPMREKEKFGIKNELPPLPSLPSLPSSPIGERISREAVKQAVKEPFKQPFKLPHPKVMEKPRTREIEEEEFEKLPIKPLAREIEPGIKTEPVFVRIDKYQNSRSKFQEVKRKILEIENLLRNIRELKEREDSQLQEWQQEIEEAKAKLNNIDKIIFSKLEE